jgi:hypothetical protein
MKKFIVKYVEDVDQIEIDEVYIQAEKSWHILDIMGAYMVLDVIEVKNFWR